MTTVAPSRANTSAVAFPIPRLAPVTIAILSFSWLMNSQLQLLQVLAEITTQVVAPECKLDRRFQKPELVAGVVTRAFEAVAVDGPVAQQMLQRIGELKLAAATRLDGFDGGKNVRRKHVAADDGQ